MAAASEPAKEAAGIRLAKWQRVRLFGLEWEFFFFFMAAPMAYGGSQARGQMGAVFAGLHHGHSNTGSEQHLQPTSQLTAMLDP